MFDKFTVTRQRLGSSAVGEELQPDQMAGSERVPHLALPLCRGDLPAGRRSGHHDY